jgi:hypothetical protein
MTLGIAQFMEKTILSAALSPTWPYNALTVQVKITQNPRSSFWEVEVRTWPKCHLQFKPSWVSSISTVTHLPEKKLRSYRSVSRNSKRNACKRFLVTAEIVRPFLARFKTQSFVTFHLSGLAKNPGTC